MLEAPDPGFRSPLRQSGESGFTLVETVVAASILGLIVSALTIVLGNTDVVQRANEQYRQARIISQQELEDDITHYVNYAKTLSVNDSIALDFNETAIRQTMARRVVSIDAKSNQDVFGDGVLLDFKTVRAEISWPKAGPRYTVTLSKKIIETQ